ncbi:MAG: hypothetical protein AMXMBFR47_26750 [Planctomycetota bacterium]
MRTPSVIAIVIITSAAVFFIGAWAGRYHAQKAVDDGPRPLFCDFGQDEETGRWGWRSLLPVSDSHGVYAYVDPVANVLAVICAGGPRSAFAVEVDSTSRLAVLLSQTPHEVIARPEVSRLRIWFAPDEVESVQIPPGEAIRLFSIFQDQRNDNLLADILQHVRIVDESKNSMDAIRAKSGAWLAATKPARTP